MARRLTTNQEIAGSIPAVLIFFFVCPNTGYNYCFLSLSLAPALEKTLCCSVHSCFVGVGRFLQPPTSAEILAKLFS
jgi:hypothetical protein